MGMFIDEFLGSLDSIDQEYAKFVKMQDVLNKEMTGNDNYALELVTKNGKPINYGQCLLSEANEIQDSLDWKHWKAGNDNLDNMMLECVDIMHFAPSVFLTGLAFMYASEDMGIDDNGIYEDDHIDVICYNDLFIHKIVTSEMIEQAKTSDIIRRKLVLVIKDAIARYSTAISNVYINKPQYEEYSLKLNTAGRLLCAYSFDIVKLTCLLYRVINPEFTTKDALDDMFKRYIIKNTLNSFRNSNGYKEGTYRKMWDVYGGTLEDNDAVFSLATEHKEEIENSSNPRETLLRLIDGLYKSF